MGPKAFDFERWARLARDDPEGFERERAVLVGTLIAAAPEELRPRLEALQWQVEQARRRARTPLAACLKISAMMWDRVLGEQGMLERLRTLSVAAAGRATAPRRSARVLEFRRPRKPTIPDKSDGS